MDFSGLFILSNDVEFIPVDSIKEKTKNSFEHADGDVVITRLNARATSKVITRQLADILLQFRAASTFAEVIWNFSRSFDKDPQQLADEVFAPLVQMRDSGFLISPGPADDGSKTTALQPGEQFRDYTVIKNLRFLDDTEVYCVKDASGNRRALKILKSRNSGLTNKLFDNETFMMKHLDGVVNPLLIEEGSEGDHKFIVMSWCEGMNCGYEALKYRNINNRDHLISLLNLCIAILQAFEKLQAQGILHGDVSLDNILISAEGMVKIVDYGYAVAENAEKKIHRAGAGFYSEPEFALSLLVKKNLSPLTLKGEQYALAVLVYYLLCGHHYLEFSYDKNKLYDQIAYSTPLSFKNFDLSFPAELDEVMQAALAKDPAERFASLFDFAGELIKIRNNISTSGNFYVFNKQNTAGHTINFLLRKFGRDSAFIEEGLLLAPTCTINYGSSGIAYMFYKMSCIKQNAELSALAAIWSAKALHYRHSADDAFYSVEAGITEKNAGKRSIYHSAAGIHLVQAMICSSGNNRQGFLHAIKAFLSSAIIPCTKMDLTTGRIGLLIGCSILFKELVSMNESTAYIVSFAEAIKNEIWQQLDEYAAMSDVNPVNYFGIAHGWAGFLYASLLWCETSGCRLPLSFTKRLDELSAMAIEDGEKIKWPHTQKNKNSLTGWCNGSAGYIFLYTLLYRYFREKRYLIFAERTANHIMSSPLINNVDLCCGMSGIAYSMMNLYRITHDLNYLEYTQKLKQVISEKWSSHSLRNNSLYKGELGIGLLLAEMEQPELARMPLFEI